MPNQLISKSRVIFFISAIQRRLRLPKTRTPEMTYSEVEARQAYITTALC
jgi:hypothetical protein